MINYLKNMKIKYPSLMKEEKRSPADSVEAGCNSWRQCIGKKPLPRSNCLFIALPVLAFLALGIYFILVDLKILASVLNIPGSNSTNSSLELPWGLDNVTFDDKESHFVVFLDTNDDPGQVTPEAVTTTEETFMYSPTVPQVTATKTELTSKTEESSEGANCFSTRLGFCEGVLPYDLVRLPKALNVTGHDVFRSLLPNFRLLVDAGCSSRARDLVCAVLEPECRPESHPQVLPCRDNCRAVVDECKHVISMDSVLSEVFDCEGNPNWDSELTCMDTFTGDCREEELRCPEGRCIPSQWLCDGKEDCPSGLDEVSCPSCPNGYFRCVRDGRCLPKELVCNGESNCSDSSDEAIC